MVCVNIKGINANLGKLLFFLYNYTYFNFKVIVLSETWNDSKNFVYNVGTWVKYILLCYEKKPEKHE